MSAQSRLLWAHIVFWVPLDPHPFLEPQQNHKKTNQNQHSFLLHVCGLPKDLAFGSVQLRSRSSSAYSKPKKYVFRGAAYSFSINHDQFLKSVDEPLRPCQTNTASLIDWVVVRVIPGLRLTSVSTFHDSLHEFVAWRLMLSTLIEEEQQTLTLHSS